MNKLKVRIGYVTDENSQKSNHAVIHFLLKFVDTSVFISEDGYAMDYFIFDGVRLECFDQSGEVFCVKELSEKDKITLLDCLVDEPMTYQEVINSSVLYGGSLFCTSSFDSLRYFGKYQYITNASVREQFGNLSGEEQLTFLKKYLTLGRDYSKFVSKSNNKLLNI